MNTKKFAMRAMLLGAALAGPVRAEEPGAVTVMTYNIRYAEGDKNSQENNWGARCESLARIVEAQNPDVIGFQEVLPKQREWLEKRLGAYVFVGEYRTDDPKSGEAAPVAFRKDRFKAAKSGTFWLSETPDVKGSISWGAKYPRICSYAVLEDGATGRRFSFANVHTDHKSELAREKGMLLAIERMKEFGAGAPIVLVGDFNCLEHEAPVVAVSKVLKDAMYLSETPPEGSWRTFNRWEWHENEISIVDALKRDVRDRNDAGKNSAEKRIDYIFVTPGTRVLGYCTVAMTRHGTHLYASDHFPSVASLVFAQ